MNNKTIITLVCSGILLNAIGFYYGYKVGENKGWASYQQVDAAICADMYSFMLKESKIKIKEKQK